MCKKNRICFIILIPVFLMLCDGIYPDALNSQGFFLLTPGEAQKLRLSHQEWEGFKQNLFFDTRTPTKATSQKGPYIVVERPRVSSASTTLTINCTSPMDLEILFKNRLAPVDMNSLEVVARKGFFSKNITDRLFPYIHHNAIFARNVEVPAGRYCVEISIADLNGAKTVRTYGLNVADQKK